jgi:hypothetical protein
MEHETLLFRTEMEHEILLFRTEMEHETLLFRTGNPARSRPNCKPTAALTEHRCVQTMPGLLNRQ